MYRLDTVEMDRTYYTEEGYLMDRPVVTTVGIFEYANPDGSVRRELRLPEEVFAQRSLDTYKGKPIILTHSAGVVNKDNVEDEIVGTILSPGYRDGDAVRAELVIHGTDSVRRSGLRELSLGYNLTLDETPGEWRGRPYDAVQRDIEVNHLALVASARAGPSARLNIDGRDAPQGRKAEDPGEGSETAETAPESDPEAGKNAQESAEEGAETSADSVPEEGSEAAENAPEESPESVKTGAGSASEEGSEGGSEDTAEATETGSEGDPGEGPEGTQKSAPEAAENAPEEGSEAAGSGAGKSEAETAEAAAGIKGGNGMDRSTEPITEEEREQYLSEDGGQTGGPYREIPEEEKERIRALARQKAAERREKPYGSEEGAAPGAEEAPDGEDPDGDWEDDASDWDDEDWEEDDDPDGFAPGDWEPTEPEGEATAGGAPGQGEGPSEEDESKALEEIRSRQSRRRDAELATKSSREIIAQQDSDIENLLGVIDRLRAKLDFAAQERKRAEEERAGYRRAATEEGGRRRPPRGVPAGPGAGRAFGRTDGEDIDSYVARKLDVITVGELYNLDAQALAKMRIGDGMRAVAAAAAPGVRLDGQSDEYVAAIFDMAKERAKGKRSAADAQRRQMFNRDTAAEEPGRTDSDRARERMIQRQMGGKQEE